LLLLYVGLRERFAVAEARELWLLGPGKRGYDISKAKRRVERKG
jgi:hypothetical protein